MGIIEIVISLAQLGLLAIMAKRVFFSGKKELSPKPDTPASHPCSIAHDLISIDAQPLPVADGPFPQTVVLKRCSRCGHHMAIGYAGKWTIADFVKQRCDIDILEGMVR